MHFYYLDEAGCTGHDLSNPEQPIFVLGGISVRDEGWNKTQDALAEMVNEYFGGSVPSGFELHAEELLSPAGSGPFQNHDRDRRNGLAKNILNLLSQRRHDIHLIGIEKRKIVAHSSTSINLSYDHNVPYLMAYDYLITYVNWFVKEKLGQSARGMIILDAKPELMAELERITDSRRFEGPKVNRVKWVVEFSYPVDSKKNPMVQMSDLVVYCAKKFLELDGGYRESWPQDAKKFYAECYGLIDERIARKSLVERDGRSMSNLNTFLTSVRAVPSGQWKRKYGI